MDGRYEERLVGRPAWRSSVGRSFARVGFGFGSDLVCQAVGKEDAVNRRTFLTGMLATAGGVLVPHEPRRVYSFGSEAGVMPSEDAFARFVRRTDELWEREFAKLAGQQRRGFGEKDPMKEIRQYQERAIESVHARWNGGAKSVCLCGPTGCGKTYMLSRLVGDSRAVWVAPRRELVEQAAGELAAMYGRDAVGVIMPGRRGNPSARIQVGTIGTLLKRGTPKADLFVLDEAHHFVAQDWRRIYDDNKGARFLGGTAVPERADGTGLNDIFDPEPVHAASYSDLKALGVVVPWKIYTPPTEFLGHDLGMDPVEAWALYAGGLKTFAFFLRKSYAYDHASRWCSRGVKARCVESNTGQTLRRAHMDGFRGTGFDILTNVFCLTEGVDVPHASVVLLARPFHHRSSFVNACGRAGRAAPGKTHAILIDLCGSSLKHGNPSDDWPFTLEGRDRGDARDDVEPPERSGSSPVVTNSGIVLSEELSDYSEPEPPPPPPFRPKPRADRVEKILDKVAQRSGAAVAEKMRYAYGGFAE